MLHVLQYKYVDIEFALREIEICTGREEAERVFQGSHETIVFTPDSAKKDDSSSTVGSVYHRGL